MYCFTIRKLQLITLVSCTMIIFSTFAMEKSTSTALDDYKLFEVVQRILDITNGLRKEFKEKYNIDISGREKNLLNFFWQGYRTQQGLFIKCDSPFTLYTPWGEIMLTGMEGPGPVVKMPFRQALFKRMKTSFWEVYQFKLFSFEDPKKYTFYELKPDIDLKEEFLEKKERNSVRKKRSFYDIFMEVAGEKVQNKAGQDTFICAQDLGTDFIYKIHEVDGDKLPEAKFLEWQDYEEIGKVRSAWKKFKEKYKASRSIETFNQ